MAYQSLYRRYRSRNFAEIKGQQHVTTALQTAVAEGRHSHAYLFSGPRGTGKTSTARVLAKALNCENLTAGEPCCECKSCLDIEQGSSFDLHELDAASNNKVDDVRDLIGKVALGSPGRTKVYILDEVHMLTAGAENALLKTLEEPPDHVVFVLATTEPHKVVSTIRSRTQHFEFHLLPGEELTDHVRWLIDDAGLDVDEAGIEYALRQGGGSARDTLSALDLVAAAGGVPAGSNTGLTLALAIGEGDPAAAIAAIQRGLEIGREPRTIGEETLDTLRDAFLASMGAPLAHLNEASREEADNVAKALGPATITRSLEEIGRALVEMRQAADPRVPLEVTLIRLTRRDGDDTAALLQRIEVLEQQVAAMAAGGAVAPPAQAAAPPAPAAPSTATPPPAAPAPTQAVAVQPAPVAPNQAAPVPASVAAPPPSPRQPAAAARQVLSQGPAEAPPPVAAPNTPAPAPARPPPAQPAAAATGAPVTLDQLTSAFTGGLLDELEQRVRARFKLGHFTAVNGDVATFALPNEHVVPRCEEVRSEVEAALANTFGRPLTIQLVVDGQAPAPQSTPNASAKPVPTAAETPDEIGDVSRLEDATDVAASSVDRLTQAFPGATVIDAPDS
ncbi:MAG: DNA polymerase-3 subunit gamma/tau [Acidimicrobiales bacterium]